MKELYELKEKLCDELKEYGKKEMSAGSLDVIDKLAHSIKNIDKIIDGHDYSGDYGRYRGSYTRDNRSYGRRGYSYGNDVVHELKELMHEAPEDSRQDFKRLISKIESM